MNQEQFFRSAIINIKLYDKLCKHHKMASHQTKDCFVNKSKINSKSNKENRKQKFEKCMVINVIQ